MLGFEQQEWKGGGAHTWWVLVASEGPNEDLAKGLTLLDLGTREPGVRRRRSSASCARSERGRAHGRGPKGERRSSAIWMIEFFFPARPLRKKSCCTIICGTLFYCGLKQAGLLEQVDRQPSRYPWEYLHSQGPFSTAL